MASLHFLKVAGEARSPTLRACSSHDDLKGVRTVFLQRRQRSLDDADDDDAEESVVLQQPLADKVSTTKNPRLSNKAGRNCHRCTTTKTRSVPQFCYRMSLKGTEDLPRVHRRYGVRLGRPYSSWTWRDSPPDDLVSTAASRAATSATATTSASATTSAAATASTPKPHSHCPRSHSIRTISNAKIKTVKLTVVVVLGYLACSAPFVFVQLYTAWGNVDSIKRKSRQNLTASSQYCPYVQLYACEVPGPKVYWVIDSAVREFCCSFN